MIDFRLARKLANGRSSAIAVPENVVIGYAFKAATELRQHLPQTFRHPRLSFHSLLIPYTTIMKLINILPLVTISTAFILPDDNVMSQIAIESHSKPRLGPVSEKLPSQSNVIENIESTFSSLMEASSNAFDQAIEYSLETKDELSHKVHKASFDTKSWIDSAATSIKNFDKHHGHHGHHHKPNMTVYELISKSKYTTKLAALINEYEDIVELLNGTSANFTVSYAAIVLLYNGSLNYV